MSEGASRLRRVAAISVTIFGFIYAVRTWVQPKLLYFPRSYASEKGYTALWKNAANRLALSGSQLINIPYTDPSSASPSRNCYLVLSPSAPKHDKKQPLWVVHGGNAMTALDWLPSILEGSRGHNSFLLVDYPGYGRNEPLRQHPTSEDAVLSNALAALTATMKTLEKESRTITEVNLLGHSLGTGASLLLANALVEQKCAAAETSASYPPVSKVLLSAPFLSIPAVAQSLLGPLPVVVYKALCSHSYNNQVNLPRLLNASPTSQVTIIHGTQDEIIPFSHAATLAKENPQVRLLEVDGAHHNDVLSHWHLYHSILVDQQGASL